MITAPDGSVHPCQFAGLNLLGMDYLDRADASLKIDMDAKEVILDVPRDNTSR